MKITYEEMRDTASRLPVGYYLGRKVPVMVEPSGGAYADIVKSEIHIGMDILAQAADHIAPADAAKWDREKLLRCVLYHEVGHVLLTPKWLGALTVHKPDGSGCFPAGTAHDILNIFEDERLERMLSSFFIGVDFNGFVHLVNGKNAGKSPKTDVQKIFAAIRLRKTTPKVSAAVDDAIQSLVDINATVGYCVTIGGKYPGPLYSQELDDLLKLILESKDEEQDGGDGGNGEQQQQSGGEQKPNGEQKSNGEQGEGDGDKPNDKPDETDETDNGEAEGEGEGEGEDKGENKDKDESEGEGEGEGEDGESDDEPAPPASNEESEPPEECQKPRAVAMPSGALKSLASQIFATPTAEVEKTLHRFAQRISKQKGAQAAGRWSALHGKIDTRRDAMDKERIFRRSSDIGERLMSAVNLTLWVDHSGSFSDSKDTLNEILAATAKAMKMSGGKLAVNVVKMEQFATVADEHSWTVDPQGNNDINTSYRKAWEKTRSKNRRNIDIVVFDGQNSAAAGYLQAGSSELALRSHGFGYQLDIVKQIWNSPDCWVVSDTDNQKLFDGFAPKSHRTYMKSGYAEQLQAKVIEILDRIL